MRRKPKGNVPSGPPRDGTGDQNSPAPSVPDLEMKFGTTLMPSLDWYYRSHEGLSIHGRLQPLLRYPVPVLALCRRFRYTGADIQGSGKAILNIVPPKHLPGLSNHEYYALWAEDILRYVGKALARDGMTPELRRYLRNKDVLEFMRTTWDALLVGYQQERAYYLTRYGYNQTLNSRRLQGVNRFRNQLVYHPLEAARRLKACAQANRAWYFGGPRPTGRLLVFEEKRTAMMSSYIARALPPAPPNPAELQGLVERLLSEPQPEPDYWKPFLKAYVQRWGPLSPPTELYTMPSANAALGFPRSVGGHVTGVQHIVLLGYALKKVRHYQGHPHMGVDSDGSYLELLSDALHPSSQLGKVDGMEKMFRAPWNELEKTLPGCGERLQDYLQVGVDYILENLEYVPVLPIVAEEKGLKTRFPTCSLTAVNLVQQILRRVADHVMIRDPRFSEALGGPGRVDMRGESGPWDSQDCTAATDYHPEWLTRGFYEELANAYPSALGRYRKWFHLLFGPKKILVTGPPYAAISPIDLEPTALLRRYPRAPLLDDDPFLEDGHGVGVRARTGLGHAELILNYWNEWLSDLARIPGVISRTGQMMGDPTSFPALMLVSLCSAEETLKVIPYTRNERRRWYKGLKRSDVKMKGIGDDAIFPRWFEERRRVYYSKLLELSARISWQKCFWDLHKGIIAEVPLSNGFEVPFWPLSILVAPPGGSKGQVTWVSQASAFGGDPTRPTRRIPKFFWKLSPYYYTWKLAHRMGVPVGAPEAYGGIDLPILKPVSLLHHTQWLSYLSQQKTSDLIIGLGLSPLGRSGQGLLDKSASDWVKEVLATSDQWAEEGVELLATCALDDSAQLRVSLEEGYRKAVGRVRSVEFYFRAPPEALEQSAPSVQMAAERFGRKVRSLPVLPKAAHWRYKSTIRDLERKQQVFFSISGGFLPDPWAKPSSVYGLDRSHEVKMRWKAPWLKGLG